MNHPTTPANHPAFLLSVGLGVLGVLLIIVGLAAGGQVIFELGFGAGAASLVAAMVWRSDLIATWRREHPKPRL